MRSSYLEKDVTILLKDITGLVEPLPTNEREKLIQSGVHYCEMLPLEYKPSSKYIESYKNALMNFAKPTAKAVCQVCERLYKKKGKNIVLVSLARAGLPIGILMKHYLQTKYNIDIPHYAISIIRGRGIDKNAMNYILSRHNADDIQFVDGWIGKGAITKQLQDALVDFENISTELAVIADPANITTLCGTHEDILIPSSCLNSTISGLISRTFLRSDIISESDFHGAIYYGDLQNEDVSYDYINEIEKYFDYNTKAETDIITGKSGFDEVKEISLKFGIEDINLIKPSIGEATRVLLRRIPWKLLIRKEDYNRDILQHLLRLAEEKNVPVEFYPLRNYRACGIIKNIADV